MGNKQHKYDIEVDIDSLGQLKNSGWPVNISQRLWQRAETELQEDQVKRNVEPIKNLEALIVSDQKAVLEKIKLSNNKAVVSVLGLFNKGKTFFMNQICNINLKSGFKVSTKGLSFMEPPGELDNIILLDTAGSAAPLNVEMRKEGCTVAIKKSTEDFLQRLSFLLSDFIIVMVNELTWPDQEYLNVLSERVQEEKNQMSYIVVVHNYRDCHNYNDFLEMRKKFCENCFDGQLTETHLGNGEKVQFFVNENATVRHVFLAQEGSGAGKYVNHRTYMLVRTWIKNQIRGQSPPLLTRICDNAAKELKLYFANISNIYLDIDHLARDNNNLDSPSARLMMKGGTRDKAPLSLIQSSLLVDGFRFTLANVVYQPNYDIIAFDNSWVVIFECPGISTYVDLIKEAGQKRHNWIGARVDVTEAGTFIEVEGSKNLAYHRGERLLCYDPHAPEEERDLVYTNRTLSSGEFKKRIPVPNTCGRKIERATLEHGKLYLSLFKDK